MTRLAILAALALSACASYDRPTYNAGTGCVESWTHSGTSIGLQAAVEDRPDDIRAVNGGLFRRSADVPRYAVGATFQFSKREDCPAPQENPVVMEAYRKGMEQ